jgi:uncharacterized protein (DUF2235 family)
MSDVLISALPRDRELAEAIKALFDQKSIASQIVDARVLQREATARDSKRIGELAVAKVVISVQTARTALDPAVKAVARAAVANGARLMQALGAPAAAAAAYPLAKQARLEGWDLRSEDHAGVQQILAFAYTKLKPPPATPRPKNAVRKRIVILCDGTWQSIRNVRKTNVAHAAMAVQRSDANGMPQITYYDDGVGALARGMQSLVQGWTGVGLDDRILAAYRFLTLNYEIGDEIYLFGFSRGAYTVRSLGGLIRTCGILRREFAHRELEAMEIYRQRESTDANGNEVIIENRDFPEAQLFRQNFARAWVNTSAPAFDPAVGATRPDQLTLAYMGVWDTVGSLGVPPSLWFKGVKYRFHDTSIGPWVQQARHAVSVDELRNTFSPTLWDNAVGMPPPEDPTLLARWKPHPTALQQWFAGDHGGVGGGDDREGLSNAALLWVLRGAEAAGLAMKPSILEEFVEAQEPIHTPVRTLRLGSLPTFLGGWRDRQGPSRPEDVHETVLQRLHTAKPRYKPGALKKIGIKPASKA